MMSNLKELEDRIEYLELKIKHIRPQLMYCSRVIDVLRKEGVIDFDASIRKQDEASKKLESILRKVIAEVPVKRLVNTLSFIEEGDKYDSAPCKIPDDETIEDHSMKISKDKDVFHCETCDMGGDSVTLLNAINQCSTLESIKEIIETFDLDIEFNIDEFNIIIS